MSARNETYIIRYGYRSRFPPLKTARRIRFHKVAEGYLFGKPNKKLRLQNARRRRNPLRSKEAARRYNLRRWGSPWGMEGVFASWRAMKVIQLRDKNDPRINTYRVLPLTPWRLLI